MNLTKAVKELEAKYQAERNLWKEAEDNSRYISEMKEIGIEVLL